MLDQPSVGGDYREMCRGKVDGDNAFRLFGRADFNAVQLQDIIDTLELQMKIAKRRDARSKSDDEPSGSDPTAP